MNPTVKPKIKSLAMSDLVVEEDEIDKEFTELSTCKYTNFKSIFYTCCKQLLHPKRTG